MSTSLTACNDVAIAEAPPALHLQLQDRELHLLDGEDVMQTIAFSELLEWRLSEESPVKSLEKQSGTTYATRLPTVPPVAVLASEHGGARLIRALA